MRSPFPSRAIFLVARPILRGVVFFLAAFLVPTAGGFASGLEACSKAQDDTAVAVCKDAISSGSLSSPDLAAAFRYRGIALAKSKQYELAIQDFDEAIRLNPNDAIAIYNRGNSYRDNGDDSRAIQDFTAA